jgi:Polyketide cyclase / dehydrase and lipid transport
MHVVTVTRRTTAKPEVIWRLWADVPNRTRWDDALERITLQGPFQSGVAGIVKLRGQPERKFKVLDTVPPRACTDRFFLPLGGKMDWAHTISEVDDEHAVTFDISITGPTSPLLAPVLKRILRRELPSTLSKLIALAEQT